MKIIIAHGSFGKPHENWIPWLEEELDNLNIEYLTPTFPTPKYQNYDAWKKVLDLYYDFGCFGNDTIFIGHSCGAIFLAKYIIEKRIKCKGYISVAGYNNFISGDELMDSLNSTFYVDDSKLADLVLYAENRVSIYSNNDPFIPQHKLEGFCKEIDADKEIILNGGHLNKSAGIISFTELLDIIKNILNK